MKLPIDEARLRPHLRSRAQPEQQQADVFQAEYERASPAGADTTTLQWKTPTGDADWQRQRGIPVITRGTRGVMPHTDPLGELLYKEARQGRRRR